MTTNKIYTTCNNIIIPKIINTISTINYEINDFKNIYVDGNDNIFSLIKYVDTPSVNGDSFQNNSYYFISRDNTGRPYKDENPEFIMSDPDNAKIYLEKNLLNSTYSIRGFLKWTDSIYESDIWNIPKTNKIGRIRIMQTNNEWTVQIEDLTTKNTTVLYKNTTVQDDEFKYQIPFGGWVRNDNSEDVIITFMPKVRDYKVDTRPPIKITGTVNGELDGTYYYLPVAYYSGPATGLNYAYHYYIQRKTNEPNQLLFQFYNDDSWYLKKGDSSIEYVYSDKTTKKPSAFTKCLVPPPNSNGLNSAWYKIKGDDSLNTFVDIKIDAHFIQTASYLLKP